MVDGSSPQLTQSNYSHSHHTYMFTEKPIFQVIPHTIKLILPEPSPLHVQESLAISRPVGLGLMELKTYNLFRRCEKVV